MEPFLALKNLSVTFDTGIQRINAVDHVSLHVNKGEIIGIIGASGSGKSTLAKTILGLQAKNQSSEGSITYNNGPASQDILSLSTKQLQQFRRNESTMVFQNPLLNLNPAVSIQKHFERVLSLRDTLQQSDVILDALHQVDLGSEAQPILDAYPHQLSGGQQQRILIAMTICQQVKVLLLDEPMSSLDKKNQEGISAILKKLVKDCGMAIILISHDLDIIGQLSNRIYVLNEGQVVESGSQETILVRPQHGYTQALLGARSTNTKVTSTQSPTPLLTIEHLSHEYQKGGFLDFRKSKVVALSNINMVINKGHITGLVGPSGSGKSTLVNILLGNYKLQKGTILWDGAKRNKDLVWKQIQMVPQNTADALNPRMLLDDQLKEVYQKCYPGVDSYDTVIGSLMADVHLEDQLRNRYPSELSGGEIQRMAIVRALIVRPDMLILDESLSALDMLVQKRLVDLIIELNKKLHMTIIMISHDDRLVRSCCDTVIHLNKGTVVSM